MTTLVTLATKDAVVLGCDSLATTTMPLVDPFALIKYFDHTDNFELRQDEDGKPLISLEAIFDHAQAVPYNHMTDVDKLVDLSPLPMGCMYTGIASIGERTIKSLLSEFKEQEDAFRRKPAPKNYTVNSVAGKLMQHLGKYYEDEFGQLNDLSRPYLEFLIGGYDKTGPLPRVVRVNVARKEKQLYKGSRVVFAGMMQEIQRIVFGVDDSGIGRLEGRYQDLLTEYRNRVEALNAGEVDLPDVATFFQDGYHLFGKLDPTLKDSPHFQLEGLVASWGDFSEQNAIDCVAYFIGIMREAHRFSSKMPTVGGPIHIALVSRDVGFRFISREEYRHEDHRVQRIAPRLAD